MPGRELVFCVFHHIPFQRLEMQVGAEKGGGQRCADSRSASVQQPGKGEPDQWSRRRNSPSTGLWCISLFSGSCSESSLSTWRNAFVKEAALVLVFKASCGYVLSKIQLEGCEYCKEGSEVDLCSHRRAS